MAGDLDIEMKTFLKKEKIDYFDLPLKKKFIIDPVKLIKGKTTHQSWVYFDQKKLNDALKDIDLIEIYEPYFFYSKQVALIAHKNNIPLITEIWTSFPEHLARFVPPYSFNVKKVIEYSDLFILGSKKAVSYLKPFNISDDKKIVIYPGVNLKRFYPSKKHKVNSKITILFVGVLSVHKGLDDLLCVFEKLVKKYPNRLELIICGRGKMKREVIEETNLLPVKYLGQVSHLKIPEIYRKADIFCGPSKDYSILGIKRWEEFVGYTLLEAMASGLAVVASDSGAIPEIVGKNNLIIKKGDRNMLYKALNRLILNRNLSLKIGKLNRKRAIKLFDIKKQIIREEKEMIKHFC